MDVKGQANLAYISTEGEDEKSKESDINQQDDEPTNTRATWGGGLEMLMSCIALSIGLGNIWRFPFVAYENGGGAFLIPYVIVLFLVGKPMYYLEMTIGQFTNRNAVRVWVAAPAFKGVGVAQTFAAFSVVSYYASLMAIALFYLAMSFSKELPWSKCQDHWEELCVPSANTGAPIPNSTSSSELYFIHEVMKQQKDIDNGIGVPEWRLALCLLASWFAIFLIMVKGIKSSGKAAYFLALFPYIIMIVLLIRAATLKGAVDGIVFFITPQWEKLYSSQVWYAAVTQVFFSLSVSAGALTMYSSYNQYNHKIYRDSMIVTTLDTFTSLLSGFTVFGILGNLAHEQGESDISKVIGVGGTSLAFVSYPDVISKFEKVPQLFSVLFFLMLYVLAIGSGVALTSTIVTTLADRFKERKYWQMSLVTCIVACAVGLVYVTPGGQHVLSLVDAMAGTFLLLTGAIFQIIGIFGVYGLENYCQDIECMTGARISKFWRWCWGFITPLLMIYVFIYAIVSLEPLKYGSYVLPPGAQAAGWALFAFGALQIPFWGIVFFFQNKQSSVMETFKKCFLPSPKWGPSVLSNRKEWENYKEERQNLMTSLNLPKWKHYWYSLNGTYESIVFYYKYIKDIGKRDPPRITWLDSAEQILKRGGVLNRSD